MHPEFAVQNLKYKNSSNDLFIPLLSLLHGSFWPITTSVVGNIIASLMAGPTLELHQKKSCIWPANFSGGSLSHLHIRCYRLIDCFLSHCDRWSILMPYYCGFRNSMLRFSKFLCHASVPLLGPFLQTTWTPATPPKQRKRHRWMQKETLTQNQ